MISSTKLYLSPKHFKMKKEKPQEEEVFFVGVQDPLEVRRNLLEVSKDMVQFLQQYEKLKTVREQKNEAIKRLKEDIRELKSLVNKLRLVLPKTKLRVKLHEEHKEPPKPVAKKVTVKKVHKKAAKKSKAKHAIAKETQATLAPVKRQPATEIEKLESELADIENKLGKL